MSDKFKLIIHHSTFPMTRPCYASVSLECTHEHGHLKFQKSAAWLANVLSGSGMDEYKWRRSARPFHSLLAEMTINEKGRLEATFQNPAICFFSKLVALTQRYSLKSIFSSFKRASYFRYNVSTTILRQTSAVKENLRICGFYNCGKIGHSSQ